MSQSSLMTDKSSRSCLQTRSDLALSVSFHSVCIDQPPRCLTPRKEIPSALCEHSSVCSCESEFFRGFLWSVQTRWQPGLFSGRGDESSPRCGPQTTCGTLSFGLYGSCVSCVSGMRPSRALCEFLRTVWDPGRLTSLGCRGPAACLQVDTEEIGLVHTAMHYAWVSSLKWE